MQAQEYSMDASERMPLHTLVGGCNGRQGVQAQLQVKVATAQVVYNTDSISAR